ncbi:MAG: response regulator [Lachnospiraceae bacterium]|nr:response regulator [Lachnospiraceae bacterium]
MENHITDFTTSDSSGKIIRAVKILFLIVLIISVSGLLWFSGIDTSDPMEYQEPVFIENWTVTSPDGTVFSAGSSYRNEGYSKGVFTMVSNLPENITDDSYFSFINGGDVAVYINGQLRKDFIAARDVIVPGGCVKRFYLRVPLYPSDSGAEVKMMRKTTTHNGYVYQNTFVAESGDFFAFLMSSYGLSFMLEAILLLFSVVIVIVSIIMMILYKRQIEMLYGALSILVIAGWLITNSFLYPFIFGHYHVDGVLNYMLCLLMPFSLAFYLDALQHGRYRRIMECLLCMAALNLIIWPILHFTRVFSFSKALIYIDLFLGIELVTVAGILINDTVKGKIKEYGYTAIGYAGFLVCGLVEITTLTFLPSLNNDIPMLFGLAFMLTLSVVQQIRDLRKVHEERQRAVDLSEAKTRFLASMSHEIRTPINAILGMNEMILRENSDPVIGEYAGSVKSSGQMLLMLVNDVLDFSKIEAGKMEITNAPFRFSSLLPNIMPMLRERAVEKNLTLQTVILNEVPDGQISDEFRIRQILINLMNNAIKYTDSGSVTLILGGQYTGEDSYMLKMSVKDTGRGIRKEDQEALFEAFSRADIKKNRNIEGTGLGLAIVKSITDSLEGTIRVESNYGEGSEFIVELPVKVTDRTPLKEDYEQSAKETTPAGAGCDYTAPEASVLAVDDNNSNLRIVKLFLKRAHINPDLCDSGSKAVELCRTKHYDLILLDHMMPDPDGIKTLGIIKTDEKSLNRQTPVVVLTANAIAGSREIYTKAGFVDYLTKPIDSSLLEQTVKKYLPDEKILPADAILDNTADKPMSLREKLEKVEGLDYDMALHYSGDDEELLKEVVDIIASECDEKISSLQNHVSSENWEGYQIEAHAIKGLLLSVGLKDLSERARKHEFAVKENNIDFIRSDCDSFFEAYRDVCRHLK